MNVTYCSSHNPTWYWLFWLLFALIVAASSACATNPKLTTHAFSFDALRDSPDAEILDYQYGDSNILAARASQHSLENGTVRQTANINGPFLRGDLLYVKWRIKTSGKMYEDTVDLRSRLPADVTNHRIYFVIKGEQLYVYLILPERKDGCPPDITVPGAIECIRARVSMNSCPPDMQMARRTVAPANRVFVQYCSQKITTIYPDQPKIEENK